MCHRRCLLSDDLARGGRSEVELIQQEVIQPDGGQAEVPQRSLGEVADVLGDDHISTTPNRCGNNVAIVRVRKLDPSLECFPPFDESIVEGLIHRAKAALEPAWVNVGMDALKCTQRLINDPS
ncbi:hypothetical protein GCM10025870_22710 [Agromyces marinus]|uniref:Uncharacterized protein n=1 Tax=Agromyces marinus TaxID=1389020 RepID=A0ABM8H337_9MICO|nr:hypothetical protein GCM10025870_22710 [Agromyces marinus]